MKIRENPSDAAHTTDGHYLPAPTDCPQCIRLGEENRKMRMMLARARDLASGTLASLEEGQRASEAG